jgi:hypothetical protein
MDDIDDFHLQQLQKGGNRKLLEFIELYDMKKFDNHDLFITKGLEFYRKKLAEATIKNEPL